MTAVSINGGLGSDTLTVDDSGSPSTDSYTVSGSAVKRTGTTLPRVFVAGTVGYVGVEAMTLLAESGANTITVTAPVPTFPVTIDAGGGTDTLVGPNATNLWQVTGADSGSVGAVTFRAAERLTGGSGNDTFRFGALAGSVGVAVNGGAGRNALDYSLLGAASPIFVDLSAGQASRVAGSAAGAVSNIQDVTGGAGADTILGSAANNILRGGGGNDVLRGGPGADTVDGGSGPDVLKDSGGRNLLIGGDGRDVLLGAADDDILIGGSTSFDAASAADDASLTSVVAEWTSARAYADRVANLRGTGLGPRANGSVFLKSAGIGQTVFSDTFADALTGGAGMDWFFDAPPDTTDAVTGELHN